MPYYLGIDTSNYTTSAAVFSSDGKVIQNKRLLPVAGGKVGLRQSDAVFAHVKQLADVLSGVLETLSEPVCAVGVSVAPRDVPGSYMPCFLVGELAARSVAAALQVPVHTFSHQAGHVAAALYGSGSLSLRFAPFLAFHVSGGTTELLHVRPDPEKGFAVDVLGRSLDLHAGQAVDRVGALLALAFPAGPHLEALALQSANTYAPRPALKGMDCCLSGVENQCRAMLEQGATPQDVARYCLCCIEQAVAGMLRAARRVYPHLPVVFAGGVMSNTLLRAALQREFGGHFAPPAFSSDNAVGTAVLCALREGVTM